MNKNVNAIKMLFVFIFTAFILMACNSGNGDDSEAGAEQSNSLTVYTAFSEDEAAANLNSFEEATGIDVNFVRLSSGQVLARIQAESSNPQASVWYGANAEHLVMAGEEGLLEPYEASGIENIPEAVRSEDHTWTPIAQSILVFSYNPEWIERNGIEAPETWDDLLDEAYVSNIEMAHPATAGTGSFILNSLVQMKGEDEAFDYLKELDQNIKQYTQSGAAPVQNVALGESGIGINQHHNVLASIAEGYSVEAVYPADGTTSAVAGVAMIEGGPADEVENAEKFIDWMISEEGQSIYAQNGQYRMPVLEEAEMPEGSPELQDLNILELDSKRAGEENDELVSKFESQIVGQEEAQE